MSSVTNVAMIVAAIYHIEGGANTRYPYGIKSVKTDNPKAVCVRTVENNLHRWHQAGKPGHFLDFLADRYCPPRYDPVGNKRWKRNIRSRLKTVGTL